MESSSSVQSSALSGVIKKLQAGLSDDSLISQADGLLRMGNLLLETPVIIYELNVYYNLK